MSHGFWSKAAEQGWIKGFERGYKAYDNKELSFEESLDEALTEDSPDHEPAYEDGFELGYDLATRHDETRDKSEVIVYDPNLYRHDDD
jgi:hypothetical protein